MNRQGVLRLVAALKSYWPHANLGTVETDRLAQDAWEMALKDVTEEQAFEVVADWMNRGERFPPGVPDILSALNPSSSFNELNEAAQHVIHNVRGGANMGNPTQQDFPSPQIAWWFMEDGYRRLREYGMAPASDDYEVRTGYEVWQAGLRKDWSSFTARISPAVATQRLLEMEKLRELGNGDGPVELGP